jgi:periplasmic protein TonB
MQNSRNSQKKLWRCEMSPEPRRVSDVGPKESLGSLSACLVDGDAEQRSRERRVKRRALAISILMQSAVLAALILVPLFGEAERISLTIVTPVVPYGHSSNHPRGNARTTTSRQTNHDRQFTFHPPTNNVNQHPVEDTDLGGPIVESGLADNSSNDGPVCSGCVDIGGKNNGPQPPPVEIPVRPRVVHMTQIDPAMLIHRVEPVYPPLARQTHRSGRVELRAIISIDGTIQSLQIVASDPLFDLSAKEAVSQWRYKPTILNGLPVEIDTYITVIYTTQQ